MFESIRKHSKLLMWVLFPLIILSFGLFGADQYQRGDGGGDKVAQVDGDAITRPEWDARHRNDIDRLRQQMPDMDVAQFDSDAARYATLERMVRERVLATAANKARMTVSEERLARLFAQEQGLASFRKPDGTFDRELFIRATGRTPEQYEASVRADLVTQQVLLGVSGTAFATRAQADATLNAFYDRREVQIVRFEAKDFASKVTVSDADLEAYYQAHAARFQAPEQATIEYLVLDLEAAKKSVTVNEADLKTYYEQNASRFGTKEERRASHILITAPASASAQEREKAKARAEELLAQARQAPAAFAELARKNSQDPGSAEKGGDLGLLSRGETVKPFEDAMFALGKGDISDVVESEFGYHIIRLDDVKPAVVAPFDQVRADIENELRAQQATQEFAKAAETFSDLVYQQPDSLKPAADALALGIQTAANVGRMPAPGASGPLANRNFLSALFTPDALERKNNTEAIEIGPSQLAAGRVTQYAPARALPFDEVKEAVRTQMVAERAAALAKTEGEAKLAAWQADAAGASFGVPLTLSRVEPQSQPAALIEGALRADTSTLPAWQGVDLGAQGYAVVRVNKVVPRTPPPAEAAQEETAQFAQAVAAAEDEAYYNLLKERFKARILVPRPPELSAVLGRG